MPKTLDEQKRAAIAQAAKELFTRYGYKKTTMDDIAQAARIAKGTVYLYYPNKKELLVAIGMQQLLESQERLLRTLEESDDAAEKLRSIIIGRAEDFYAFSRQYPDAQELLPFFQQEELLRQGGAAYFANQTSMLQAVLAEGMEKGIFRSVDVDSMAEHIIFMFQAFEPPYRKITCLEALSRHVEAYTETLLGALERTDRRTTL